LLASEEQLEHDHRQSAVVQLLDIYSKAVGSGFPERAARSQSIYLAAASGLSEGREFGLKALDSAEDPWIRRSIVRGLAKSGALPPEIGDRHEQELVQSGQMKRIDLGFWASYAGDHKHIEAAIAGQPPPGGYHRTLNAILRNLVDSAGRDTRRFDFRTGANLLREVAARAVTRDERDLITKVVRRQPRERDAKAAWQDFCEAAEQCCNLS